VLATYVAAPGLARADITEDIFNAVVQVEAAVPADARTARTLGTERSGSGVVIDSEGLIVTIGYLILEAESVDIVAGGQRTSANIIAYDYDTGFGLLRASVPPGTQPLEIGDSASLDERAVVLVASHGGPEAAQRAMVVSRREFAGYWEYLLDNAIFTAPPHPQFGGAALIDEDGKLLGIGSLIVGDAVQGDSQFPGNMFVPIDLLKPILGDLLAFGHGTGPRRPWLGMTTEEVRGHLFVNRVSSYGPASKAGVEPGDIVLTVNGEGVSSLVELYRRVWALGAPGVDVTLTVVRDGGLREIVVQSADRYDFLRLKRTY
jgi:S1-C subfamily serine protease